MLNGDENYGFLRRSESKGSTNFITAEHISLTIPKGEGAWKKFGKSWKNTAYLEGTFTTCLPPKRGFQISVTIA
jgi:hypothetical protein